MTSKKKLGFWSLLALVLGNMIGSGIFMLPASLAQFGTFGLMGWVFTSIGAMTLALIFARLSQERPAAGGPYAYVKEGLGDFMGFLVAWTYWISLWVGSVAPPLAAVGYLSFFFPEVASNPLYSFSLCMVIIWGLTAINLKSVKMAGIVQITTTILKLLPIALIILVGFFFFKADLVFPLVTIGDMAPITAMMGASTLTLWAFIGVESATIPAAYVKDPKKNIPRATIIGTLSAAIIYFLTSLIIYGIIPLDQLQSSTSPFADAANIVLGPWGSGLIAIGAIISSVGSLNGWVLIQAQIPHAASDDGLFPRLFSKTSKKNNTPTGSLLLTASLMTVLLSMNYSKGLVSQFTFIITLAVLAILTCYLFSVIAELIIAGRQNALKAKKMSFGGLLVSAIAFVYVIWAIIGSGEHEVFLGALLLFGSTPVYVLIKWHHEKSTPRKQQNPLTDFVAPLEEGPFSKESDTSK